MRVNKNADESGVECNISQPNREASLHYMIRDEQHEDFNSKDLKNPTLMNEGTSKRDIQEQAKILTDQSEDGNTIYEDSPKTPYRDISNRVKHNEEMDKSFHSSNVQCAQRQRSYTDLSCSPLQHHQQNHINLVTPEAAVKRVPTESNLRTDTTHDYSKALAVGRKLFRSQDRYTDDDEVTILSTSNSRRLEFNNRHINSEVQVLGERKFHHTCNSMSNQADEMYNTNLCLGSVSSSSKENFVPRRVVNASKYLVTPYGNDNSQISPSDMKNYETIITLCDIDEFKTKWAIEFDNCRVSVVQLGTSVKINGWVDSYVINCLCRKKFKDNHPRNSNMHYFFNTTSDYFLEKWQNEETRLRWKKNAIKGFEAANGARSLHLSERLFFPSLYIRHWFVFAVDLKARNFLFLDSINGKDCQYSKDTSHLLIKNFKEVWHLAGLKNMRFETFRTVYPNVPKQNNGNDCGIFATKFLNYCPRNPSACTFSWKDVPEIRIKLANELQFCTYNELQDSIRRVLDFNPKKYRRDAS